MSCFARLPTHGLDRAHASFLPFSWFLAMAMVGLTTMAIPADAQTSCFRTGLPQNGLSDTGDHILRVHVDGEDVLVEVLWADDPTLPNAQLVMITPSGEEAAALDLERAPGASSAVRLIDALAGVATAGFQYIAQLVDFDGVRAEQPFRLTVDCPPGTPCTYGVIEGLTAGSVVVSGALWDALALAREGGSTDLLATVRTKHPELARALPGLLWQWARGDAGATQDQCRCRWLDVATVSPLPGQYLGPAAASPQALTHRFGENAIGAAFVVGAQVLTGTAGIPTSSTTGRTRLGVQLLCTVATVGGEERLPTSWPSMPELIVEDRVLAACLAPCTPRIDFTGRVRGCAQATAASRQGQPVRADALVNVDLFLDGWSKIVGTATAQISAGAGQTARDSSVLDDTSSVTVHGLGLTSRLETSGSLDIDIPAPSVPPYSYGFGAVSAEYSLGIEATATCSDIPSHVAALDWFLDAGNQGGGVAMERWEDP